MIYNISSVYIYLKAHARRKEFYRKQDLKLKVISGV